jgi:methylthioribulose-1-phosphate dehydratase
MSSPSSPLELSSHDQVEVDALAALVRTLNALGHNPATSGNYSLRLSAAPDYALISQSGIEKDIFTKDHFLPIHIDSGQLHPSIHNTSRKTSDETAVHLTIYQSTQAHCVLHSHRLEALLFANLFPNQPLIDVRGLELLKGIDGIRTHESAVSIACFDNTQDMSELASRLRVVLSSATTIHAILLRHHGLYVWGRSVSQAKRHLEVFNYVFDYYLRSRGQS